MERGFGDNSNQVPQLSVTVKMFNSLTDFIGGLMPVQLEVPPGTVIGDLVTRYQVPVERIHLILVNGRDTSKRLGEVNLHRELEDGDVVALSGPVPYSYGYGAPIV